MLGLASYYSLSHSNVDSLTIEVFAHRVQNKSELKMILAGLLLLSNRIVVDCRDSSEVFLESVEILVHAAESINCGTIKSYENEDFGDALSKVMPKVFFLSNEQRSNEQLERSLSKCETESR